MIPFTVGESNPEYFIIHKTEAELLEEEMVCFHTKLRLGKDKGVVLGAGVSITRLPRTGEIRSVTSAMDLLSLQAYIRDGLRTSLSGEKFTHFLPLYFGVEKEKTVYLVKKALSMISTGSTRKFNPTQILEILPKMFLTLMVDITGESVYHSNKAVKMMIYIHRLINLMLDEYPDQRTKVEAVVQNFIKDKGQRIKDKTPNIGELLIYLSLTDKFKWDQIRDGLLEEQTDRQIFWLLKQFKELEKEEEKKGNVEFTQEVIEASYKATDVGFRIVMFLKAFKTELIQKRTLADFAKFLDKQYSQLGEQGEVQLRLELKRILEVRDYKSYYAYQGKPLKDDNEMKAILG